MYFAVNKIQITADFCFFCVVRESVGRPFLLIFLYFNPSILSFLCMTLQEGRASIRLKFFAQDCY